MTGPLAPPDRRDPRRRLPVPLLPPGARSRAGLALSARAGLGLFHVQHCADCGAVAWPPRDACGACLSVDLRWRDTDPVGEVLAQTVTRASTDAAFRDRLPLRVGTVRMACGPAVVAFLHGDVGVGDTVRLALHLDRAGQGVMIAMPQTETPHMADDPSLRALTCGPRHRRVLLTDGDAPVAMPLARALLAAGAEGVLVGRREVWLPCPDAPDWAAVAGVETLPLDVTDERSVARAAASVGGKVDILVNTARHIRPGGILGGSTSDARDALEVNVLGPMRLARAFTPAMAARSQDGVGSAVAWVEILSVFALSPAPGYGAFGVSQAAARAVTQALRAELRGGGIRVLDVLTGPTDDEWYRELPAPKVSPAALARTVVDALQRGLEQATCGEIAADVAARWRADADLLERELGLGDGT